MHKSFFSKLKRSCPIGLLPCVIPQLTATSHRLRLASPRNMSATAMEVTAASTTTSSSASLRSNSFSVEERLNLSLDALIKERKKETKKEIQDKKRQSVKAETTAKTPKQDKTKEKQNQQQTKRKALANKNRGLEALPEPKKGAPQKKEKKNSTKQQPAIAQGAAAKKNKKAQAPVKVVPVAAAAKKKAVKAKKAAQVTNVKQKVNTFKPKQQQSLKKKQQQVVVQPYIIKKVKQQPGLSPKSLQKQPERRVTQASRRGNKLQVTIRRVEMKQQLNAKKQKQEQSKKRPANSVLPGKTPKAMAKMQRAQHVVKRVQSHKQTSKNGKFIVRKPFMARK